jgi:hypothetical protein
MTATSGTLGQISIQLQSDSWGSGPDSAAVVEVVPEGGTHRAHLPKVRVACGVNCPLNILSLAPGDYTVRMYLPNGDIMAESVSVTQETQKDVRFEMRPSPHEWLSAESAFGAVQRLLTAERARALETFRSDPDEAWGEQLFDTSGTPDYRRSNARVRVTQAIAAVAAGSASVERISGTDSVPKIAGWRRLTKVDDLARSLPEGRLATAELVRWWTGIPEPDSAPLEIANHDERNALLATPTPVTSPFSFISGERRAFAAVKDPTDAWHYAVLPEGWARTSRSSVGSNATANVLMTVVIDSVMRGSDEIGEAARWRCAPAVSDVEAMCYLGFLYSGQSAATELFLDQVKDFLFEKTVNPVAAAAGAFGLLTLTPETNTRQRPQWRNWIGNLYSMFPHLPDGAIAMARMYLRYGEGDAQKEDDIDVEKLRRYALDAVRRGLPYLSFGINPLSEILLMLVRDDEEHQRSGPPVEDTRRAHRLVQQLGRIAVLGTSFTVLELGATQP